MATTANIHAPSGAVTILRMVDAVLNLKRDFADWRETRVTRKELSRLTDTQLEDIGLTRFDVDNM